MPPSRIPIIIGSLIVAVLVVGGIFWSQRHSDPAHGLEESNTTPQPPSPTNTRTQPNPKSAPAKNSNEPLPNAIRDQGSLKAALETLQADASFDTESQLYRLGLDRLPITDPALAVIAQQTQLRALYLFDKKITDADLA